MSYNLIRNAHVDVKSIIETKHGSTYPVAEITVNGEYTHRFKRDSRVSEHLKTMTPKELSQRFTGGTFMFAEGSDEQPHLIDFRDGQYTGFIHTDETVRHLFEQLGVKEIKGRGTDPTLKLRRQWSKHEMQVPTIKDGGAFTTHTNFLWSPFIKHIDTEVDIVRMICSNGMVATSTIFNGKIPLLNRWQEHLNIADRQVQTKLHQLMTKRVDYMTKHRSTVGDCMRLEQHAFNRVSGTSVMSAGERERLLRLLAAVSPSAHLDTVYQPEVFLKSAIADQLPSHLTLFDTWNIATEMRSHSPANERSTSRGLDMFATRMMFDAIGDASASARQFARTTLADFSSPERAFFGEIEEPQDATVIS